MNYSGSRSHNQRFTTQYRNVPQRGVPNGNRSGMNQQRMMQAQAMEKRMLQQQANYANNRRLQGPTNRKESGQNVLIYSNNCQHCLKFLDILKKSKVYSTFSMICADNNMVNIPSGVKKVPSIIIYNNNGPHLLDGNNAFEWLNNTFDKPDKSVNIDDYDLNSLNGNGYSFIGEDDKTETGSNNFSFLNENIFIETQPEHSEDKVDKFNSDLDRISQMRQVDLVQHKAPPTNTPDFSVGINQDTRDSHDISNVNYNKLNDFRKKDIHRGAIPIRAPKFQSVKYNNNNPTHMKNRNNGQQIQQHRRDTGYHPKPKALVRPNFQRTVKEMRQI